MGAEQFYVEAQGKDATEAFRKVVDDARYDFGHEGYTGTIAEKDSFTLIQVPTNVSPEKYAQRLIDERDERVDDKWGPAGCIELSPGNFLFFGWASS